MSEFRGFVAFLALPLIFAACGTNEPGPDPRAGAILFQTNRYNVARDIAAVDASGRNLTRLTNRLGDDGWPTWSPDTLRIAFESDRSPTTKFQVYVMNSDGSNVTRVTSDTGVDIM